MINKFANELKEEVLGFFVPGKPIVVSNNTVAFTATTQAHESAHQVITEGSSLGGIALYCGMVLCYSTESTLHKVVDRYLNKFYEKSLWVQEGTATAFERFFFEETSNNQDMPLRRPSMYMEASTEILSFLETIWDIDTFAEIWGYDFAKEIISDFFIPLSLAEVGIISMSPPLPAVDSKSSLGAQLKTWESFLSKIWIRYKAIISTDPSTTTNSILDQIRIRRLLEKSELDPLGIKDAIREGICNAAELPLGNPPDYYSLVSKYTPDLLEHIEIVDVSSMNLSDQMDVHTRFWEQTLFKPAGLRLQSLAVDDIQRLRIPAAYAVVFEVIPFLEGSTGIALHIFEEDNYIESLLIRSQNPLPILVTLTGKYLQGSQGICRGIIVGRESERDHLGNLLSAFEKCVMPLYLLRPSDVKQKDAIGVWNNMQIDKLTLQDGGVCFSLGSQYVRGPLLTISDRRYLWVLRNGMTAILKYNNYHERSNS